MIYFLNIILFYFLTLILGIVTYIYLAVKMKIPRGRVVLALAVMLCIIINSMMIFQHKYGFNSYSMIYIFLVYVLCMLTIHDLLDKCIPLRWLVLGGVMGSVMLVYNPNISILEGIAGSFITGVLLVIISKVTRGGIGIGDGFVFAFISLIVGWKMALTVLILAFMLSGFIGIVLFVLKKVNHKTSIPFMPFILAVTIFILWT
ncbi:MAG: hypothetical protein CVU84_11000 [Firmicutes bacterium HGW-Firmicutes-1]|jgi:leader peptidase (prepilin peptidase)/N-methyltransferase|nr:MAG: hypothetical protein CVU84_11000 [Firmicutes bacterium HGW-Firmicutes-1]